MGVGANADGTVTGLTVSGSGYIDTPWVEVSGGGGTGATARAVIDYNTGALTSIILTNPGTNYTSAPTFTLIGGGNGATGAIGGTAALAANASGSLTKVGNGTMALSGNNTFTGGVFLNAGTLGINSTNALGTGTLTLGAAGVTIDNTGGAPITSANSETWGFNFNYGGTQNLTLSGPISLGPNSGAMPAQLRQTSPRILPQTQP